MFNPVSANGTGLTSSFTNPKEPPSIFNKTGLPEDYIFS
jgi:hypothetical protein